MMNQLPGVAAVILGLGILSIASPALAADSPERSEEEEAVLAVVERFLDALTSHDAEATRELMTEEGVFHRVETGGEDVVLRSSSHGEIVRGVEEGSGDYTERLREPTVLVHGPIAVVWAPYDFHVDQELSHCGVDAFSLVAAGDGAWKIAGVVYTAEDATNCPI